MVTQRERFRYFSVVMLMAKPIEMITVFEGKEARSFIEKMEKPPENRRRDATIKRAKALKLPVLFDF